AAKPHTTVDPVVVSAHTVLALQSLVSRETDPLKSLVISVAMIHGGDATNVIPNAVTLSGTVRTLMPDVRDFARKRVTEVAEATAAIFGARAEVKYDQGYPVT
ncbi:peptidase dimerization domain-containing protein, partial [Enterobacter hormaechei]|nr:peptidase dimerization domain-containing protein [Enterobacter hormaechei]